MAVKLWILLQQKSVLSDTDWLRQLHKLSELKQFDYILHSAVCLPKQPWHPVWTLFIFYNMVTLFYFLVFYVLNVYIYKLKKKRWPRSSGLRQVIFLWLTNKLITLFNRYQQRIINDLMYGIQLKSLINV